MAGTPNGPLRTALLTNIKHNGNGHTQRTLMYTKPHKYRAPRAMRMDSLAMCNGCHTQWTLMYTKPDKHRAERPVCINLTTICHSWHAQWTLTDTKPNTYQTTRTMGTPYGPLCTKPNKYRTQQAMMSKCAFFVMVVTPNGP